MSAVDGRSSERPTLPVTFEPRPYMAPWWLRGNHAQSVAGKLLRPKLRLSRERVRLDTPDGDFLDIDLGPEPPGTTGAPLGLVLHGLCGSTQRGYVQLTFRSLLEHGVRPVGLNFRSCSGEPNRTARAYHSGETGDLAFTIDELRQRFPRRDIGAVGFSLGGNVLLKFLGEEGATSRLRAAAVVSVPYDLAVGADTLERGLWGRLYTEYFLRTLRATSLAKAPLLREHVDLERIRTARTLREFDDAATAPLHGFRDARDYYARSSSAAFLEQIRTPTLLIHSMDDPFLPSSAVPQATVRENPWLVTAFTESGGHVGFVAGEWPWSATFWAEAEAARFVAGQLDGASRPDQRPTTDA